MSENTTRSRQPLLRDEDQKMIAGVCTGLGHHFDVDPVVFRILFGVLTFFGGLGVLAYAACWLAIPARGGHDSEAHRLLSGPNVYVAAAAAALMVLGLLWFTDILANRFDRSLPLILAAAAAIGVVIWRRENRGDPRNSDDGPISGAPFSPPQPWWQRPVSDHPQPATERPDGAPATGPFTTQSPAEESTATESVRTTPDKDDPVTAIPEPLEPADRIEPTSSAATPTPSDTATATGPDPGASKPTTHDNDEEMS